MIAITIDIFAYFCVEKSNSFDLQKTLDNIQFIGMDGLTEKTTKQVIVKC